MPRFKKLGNILDWLIRIQGAYAILAAILASGFGTAVKAILRYHTSLPTLWVTPIWLFATAIVLLFLLSIANYLLGDKKVGGSLESPNFVFELANLIWIYDSVRDMTLFFHGARILSKGSLSITQAWSATYSIGTSSEPMKPFYLATPYVLPIGDEQLTIENGDLLNVKTAENGIERGTAVHGRLLFGLSGNRDAQIKSLRYQIKICFQDYASNTYTSEYVPSPEHIPYLMRFPQERANFIQKSDPTPLPPVPDSPPK